MPPPRRKHQEQMLSEKLERWSNAAQQDQRGTLTDIKMTVLGAKTKDKKKIVIKWDQSYRKGGQ